MGMEKKFKDLYGPVKINPMKDGVKITVFTSDERVGMSTIFKYPATVREMGQFLIECAKKMEENK